MNVKRFTARTSRDALALVKQAFGDDAVVMSTRPCAEGVEVLAMAPESVQQLERVGAGAPAVAAPRGALARSVAQRAEARVEPRMDTRTDPRMDGAVEQDVEALQMSTLSFQDYVRERNAQAPPGRAGRGAAAGAASARGVVDRVGARAPVAAARPGGAGAARAAGAARGDPRARARGRPGRRGGAPGAAAGRRRAAPRRDGDDGRTALDARPHRTALRRAGLHGKAAAPAAPGDADAEAARRRLVAVADPQAGREPARGCRRDRLGLRRAGAQPAHRRTRAGAGRRGRRLRDDRRHGASARPRARPSWPRPFATRHGAANLGLITLDAYRVGAHEQLRTYGRILGVPVHTAHDRASLEDLLELLAGKKMVLIDTAGMAQRDARTRELLEMLSHRSINKLLVVNAASQGETIDEVLAAYNGPACRGIVISKLDEAVKLGPALDAMIRHRLKVVAVANGQRVPEDWHRLSANALVQRALRGGGSPAWRMDSSDMNLVFAATPPARPAAPAVRA